MMRASRQGCCDLLIIDIIPREVKQFLSGVSNGEEVGGGGCTKDSLLFFSPEAEGAAFLSFHGAVPRDEL